ncbi:DUF6126 family protein [Streptomyces sp. M19]
MSRGSGRGRAADRGAGARVGRTSEEERCTRCATPPGRAHRARPSEGSCRERREPREGAGRGLEGKGIALRALFYILGTHLLAGFLWLLFYLGEHAQK